MEILFLITFVVGFFLGKYYGFYKVASMMKEVAEERGFDLVKELGLNKEDTATPQVYKLEVETHGDMLYLFDKESDNFICQGSSVQELAKFAKDYKNVTLAAVKYNNKIFAFKDGESIEVLA
jgi:hypothetical protein